MSEASNGPGLAPARGMNACLPGAHASEPTAVDERARRLSHEELAVAVLLAGEGHRVVAQPERRGNGPVADLEVCGRPVEVKSFLTLDDRKGWAPTERSVCNKLRSGRSQAPTVILDGRASGLTEETAREGVAGFVGRSRVGRITGIRVLGDGFDLSWSLRLVRESGVVAVPIPPSERADPRQAASRPTSPRPAVGVGDGVSQRTGSDQRRLAPNRELGR
jgi:hypothetical protein